jgi:hypothetical protein
MKIDVDYRLANNSGNITSFKDDEILHLPAIGESIELNQCDLSGLFKVKGVRGPFKLPNRQTYIVELENERHT